MLLADLEQLGPFRGSFPLFFFLFSFEDLWGPSLLVELVEVEEISFAAGSWLTSSCFWRLLYLGVLFVVDLFLLFSWCLFVLEFFLYSLSVELLLDDSLDTSFEVVGLQLSILRFYIFYILVSTDFVLDLACFLRWN